MAKKQQPQILSPENYIRQRARNLPIFKCYINEGWDEGGMAQVTIARRHINGNITYCSYLVDLQCLGVKDTMFDFNIPEEQFDEFVEKMWQGFELIEADYALAHNIIHAGWEFAEEIGFKPHKDFLSTTRHMLEEDNDTIPIIEIHCGGIDGKPLYVQGPFEDDAIANRIIGQLEKRLGGGNFHYILKLDDPPYNEIDWDDDGGDNEEEDDELPFDVEDWDEEDDQEIFFREYAENSYEENVAIFLELSQYLNELDQDEVNDDDDDDQDVDEDDVDEDKNDENFARLLALAEILYREIIPEEEYVLWEEKWEEEVFLYSINEDAMSEMLGLPDESSLTRKDIAYINTESDNGKLEKYFRKRWGDLPYLSAMDIQDMGDSPLKNEKIAAALVQFPDYGLLRLEDRMNRITEHRLNVEELRYESVFGSREEITPAEYVRLQTLRLCYFIEEENFAGLESLYFSIQDEIDFDDEDFDERIGIMLSMFQATRISMLRMYLLSRGETGKE